MMKLARDVVILSKMGGGAPFFKSRLVEDERGAVAATRANDKSQTRR